jgi:DNA-binding transcriptional LysR family regulator
MRVASVRFAELDLNLLVALDVVFSERNVGRAAARLSLTQSAVSNALARLRRHFNDPLVTRIGGEMAPTALGVLLQPELTELLMRIRDFATRSAAFMPLEADREFRLIAQDFISYVLIPPIVQRLKSEAPNVKIRLMPYTPYATDQLTRGEADLCIGLEAAFDGPFEAQRLYDEALICIGGPQCPFRGDRLTSEQFHSARHAAFMVGDQHQNAVRQHQNELNRIALPREVSVWLPSIGALLEIVSETDCIATISAHIAHRYKDRFKLNIYAPPFQASLMPVFMQHHRRMASDLGLSWLRQVLTEVAGDLGPPLLFQTYRDNGLD